MPLSKDALREVIEAFHLPEEFLEIILEGTPIFLPFDADSCILKTPRLSGRDVTVAFSFHSDQVRAMVIGWHMNELHENWKSMSPFGRGKLDFNTIIGGLVRVLLNVDASDIRTATETLQEHEPDIEIILKQLQDLKDTHSDVYIALNRAKVSLATAKSSTRYIGHLLERIGVCGSYMNSERRMYFESIADDRLHEIECLEGKIEAILGVLMFGATLRARQDQASLRTTNLLTFAFLPATFTAVSICPSF
jgi:hypothetical protein